MYEYDEDKRNRNAEAVIIKRDSVPSEILQVLREYHESVKQKHNLTYGLADYSRPEYVIRLFVLFNEKKMVHTHLTNRNCVVWENILNQMTLSSFEYNDEYNLTAYYTNYSLPPFFVDFDVYERGPVRDEIISILKEAFPRVVGDEIEKYIPYYIVRYMIAYYRAKVMHSPIEGVVLHAQRDKKYLESAELSSLQPIIYTINGVNYNFTWTLTRNNMKKLFSPIEIIDNGRSTTSHLYIIDSEGIDNNLSITEVDFARDKKTKLFIDLSNSEWNFPLNHKTLVTKFYMEGHLLIFLRTKEKCCTILFEVGSLSNYENMTKISSEHVVNIKGGKVAMFNEDKPLLVINVFEANETINRFRFKDILYVKAYENSRDTYCWYSLANEEFVMPIAPLILNLMGPQSMSVISRAGGTYRDAEMYAKEGDRKAIVFNNNNPKPAKFQFIETITAAYVKRNPISVIQGIIGEKHSKDILLIKPLEIQLANIVAVLYGTSPKKIKFFSFERLVGIEDKSGHLIIELNDDSRFNDVESIEDFDIIVIDDTNADTMFYLQFIVKKKGEDARISMSHGLFFADFHDTLTRKRVTLIGNKSEQLDIHDVNQRFTSSENTLFKNILNRNYYLLYKKPHTNQSPLIFDYIFFKTYHDDKLSRLVLFSFPANKQGSNYTVKELRLPDVTIRMLIGVFPIIINDNIHIIVNTLKESVLYSLDGEINTQEPFNFASRLSFNNGNLF
jgi:hypothetical protein